MTISIILSIIANTEYQQTVYAGKDSEKELCKENGGGWKDGECDFYEIQMKEGLEVKEDNYINKYLKVKSRIK
ncbi:MAG TPA: hypothetical protein VFM31_05535 [Nitrososphaeraceae archaeon]|nr:hypothetical protein [Nitrososphaeraceae archaeon]